MSNIILSGNIPYIGAVILMAATGFLSYKTGVNSIQCQPPVANIAIAEKDSLILATLLKNPDLSEEQITSYIKTPVINVINRYKDNGYLVINVENDQNGNYSIVGLPSGAIDITDEIHAEINKAMKK